MHTVTETEAQPRFAFLRSEDTKIAVTAAFLVGIPLLTLAGFYFGTIAGHNNHPEYPVRHVDLRPDDLDAALPFAGAGFVLGLVLLTWVVLGYVPAKLREIQIEDHAHGH